MTTATREYKVVGTRPIRHDGVDKVTGRAVYGADLNLPGMLYGKVLRSPHAHARILSIDTSRATAHPDARAVVTSLDFAPSDPVGPIAVLGQMPADNVLARDKVLYKGHAIAAVSASSPHAAEEMLSLIDVEYEALPAYTNVPDAMADDAVPLHDTWSNNPDLPGGTNVAAQDQYRFGDPEAGFAEADRVFDGEFTTKSVHQGYIEPQNATAWWAPDDRLTVWCSSQGHFGVRDNTSRILGMPVSRVKVVPLEIGGGFGGKIPPYLEPVAALLSKKSGHPVKMVMDRAEVLEATGPTSGSLVRLRIGVTNEGRITAAHCWMALEAGAFPGAPLAGAASAVFAPYLIENVQVDGYDVVTNKPRTQAYRAPGAPIVMYCTETLMDEIAEALGIDSVELRLMNVARQGDRRADGVMNGRIGAEEVMHAVQEHSHFSDLLDQSDSKLRGRGWSMGFCRNNAGPACVVANVLDNGTVSLVEGSVDIGGTRTAIAQQFAEVLGIPVEDVNPSVGDTDTIGYTSVTGGSGVAFKSGWAAHEAAMDVMQQLIVRASLLWDTDPENVEYVDGALQHKSDSELRMSFEEISGRLAETGGPVVGRANLNPGGQGGSYSANIVDVEVDPDTGKVDILRYTAFQDAGFAIHPSYVEGQIQGGAVQGIGWALNEEYYMGEDGSMMNTSLLDYRMPTSLDLPMIDAVIVEVNNPGHPFGVRGVGEANIAPPLAALANAIHDATGARLRSLPMNPQSVAAAIEDTGE